MQHHVKKTLTFLVRWGIAAFGIYYVVSNISVRDRVMVQGPDGWPQSLAVAAGAQNTDTTFRVLNPSGQPTVNRDELLVHSDRTRVAVNRVGQTLKYDVLALKVTADPDVNHWPLVVVPPRNLWQRFWNQRGEAPILVAPAQLAEPYQVRLPYPLVERGMAYLIRGARSALLWLSLLIVPLTFAITSYRWELLLSALNIRIKFSRVFVLNMVGCFYNTFMPGSTGGDVFKAYYASKQTPHRTQAVMSVVVDRVIGLLALIIFGGAMAALQRDVPACRRIAIASALIIAATVLGLYVFYHPLLRRVTGLDFVMKRLPMQKQVQAAVEVMEIYRRRSLLVLWTIVVSFPVHATVAASAMFAGMAFGLPLLWWQYWAIVPVIVLAGSLPISPQGAGVMEAMAIVLMRPYGCTITHVFTLTMSIRIVQILWNLTGGLFVLRGGFHAPTAAERSEM